MIETRAFRNNNPGNIKHTPDYTWEGELTADKDGFAVFIDVDHGYRALAILLSNYYNRHGLNTVHKIMDRYATEHGKEPTDYIKFVAGRMGVGADDAVAVMRCLYELMTAISIYESGEFLFTRSQVWKAVFEV